MNQSRRTHFEWLLLLLALLSVGGALAFVLGDTRSDIKAGIRDRLIGDTRMIEMEVTHHIVSAARALNLLAEDPNYWQQHSTSSGESSNRRLHELASVAGAVRAFLVIDRDGKVIATSYPDALGQDFSTRPFFLLAKTSTNPNRFILSPPFRSLRGDVTLAISKPVLDQGGSFNGVLVAGLHPEFFSNSLLAVNHAEDMRTGLIHSDGTAFVFTPRVEALEKQNLDRPGTLFSRHRAYAGPTSFFDELVASTGEHRMAALRTLAIPDIEIDGTLVASASRDPAKALAEWHEETIAEGAVFVFVAVLSMLGLWAYQTRRQTHAATELAHLEAERKTAERLRLATATAAIGVWEFDIDRRVMAWDAAMFHIYQLPHSTDPLPYDAWRSLVIPSDLERVEKMVKTVIHDGTTLDTTFTIRRGSGDARLIRVMARAFDAGDSSLRTLIGINEDITEQRKKDAELHKLAHALESTANAVLITDSAGNIEYVNSACCAWYGYRRDQLIGRNPRIFKSEFTAPEFHQDLWNKVLAGHTCKTDLVNRTASGELLYVSSTITPIFDLSGNIVNFVQVQEDRSQEHRTRQLQRDVEQRMIRVERMEVLGAMAGGVAHDFNNILVAILGYSGLGRTVALSSGASQKLVAYFEEIEIAGDRARALVQQLLTFSRGGRVASEPVQVADTVREVASLIRVTFAPSVNFSVHIEENLPLLAVDQTQLHQVLMNLCANARDALSNAGEVSIAAARIQIPHSVCDSCHSTFGGEFVRISVSDTGTGIDEAIRERAFEPFVTTKGAGQGVGMGLAVVHGVTHLYDGHVTVDSSRRGTTIAIHLPVNRIAVRDSANVAIAG